jgi:two-component system, cell cycle sensor histidine kinase and response regulator CckA
LIYENGEHLLYNLETGEQIPIVDKSKIRLLADSSVSLIKFTADEVLCPLKGFPNLYYTANTNVLKEQKRSLGSILFNLCLFILILALLVSFFIAKAVGKPLEAMAKEAIEIARRPTNIFINEDNKDFIEFRQLAMAFNQVLSSLFTAQEELKSKARKELEDSEERYRLTVEAAPDSITLSRLEDGRFLQVNEMFLKNTGFTEKEVIGKTPIEINLFPNPNVREKIMRELREKEEINRMEVKYRFKDGRLSDSLMSARKIKYHGEDCIISIVSDYTQQKKAEEDKKRLEAALQRASKMEAIGTMAGGVAHDLNNILSGLVGYPELLLMDLPENSHLRKPLLTMQKSGEKAAAIVQDMLTLARRGVSVTEVVNLNNIILEQIKSPEHQKMISYHSGIKVNMDLDPNLLNIIGSEVHLSKTIMNLISNAIDAMPSGGDIKISTENKYIDTNIRGYDTVNEGDYVVLTVSDNGIGIPQEDQERIFEPFYTKKKMGRSGTGLGMAVVWGTVKDHNGYIDLQSDVGKGSTFKLYFPVTRKQLVEEDSVSPVEKYMGRGESVLVVDDVVEQREIASGMLMRLGYSVVTVSSGEDAVEYLKQNSVDILVLDMIMAPGIDGLETYKRILAIHPDQKAIVASGYAETDRVKEAQMLGAGAYIKKPYLIKNIGPAIRKELDK